MTGGDRAIRTDARVSVALCTYNGATYLQEQLASISGQTRPPDELVVCDDRSSDGTVDIVERFAADAAFAVHVVVHPRTLGSTKNFEAAVALCRGSHIALADQDDVWHPDKLETLCAALDANTGAMAAFSDARLVDATLRPLGRTLWQEVGLTPARQAEVASGRAVRLLLRAQVVTGATLMFRASEREILLPFAPRAVHDAWVALLLAAVGTLIPIPRPLLDYRQHSANQIGARRATWLDRVRAVRTSTRMSSVPATAAALAGAAERLQMHRDRLHNPDDLALVRAAAEHLGRRAGLAERRWRRIYAVVAEFARGRYARHSNGVVSALKDLAR